MNRAPDPNSICGLLQEGVQLFNGATPRLDAEVLLACVLDRPRSHLLAWPEQVPAAEQQARYRELVTRRAAGEPVAYLVGQREFWSLPLTVTPDTLIPRPETETLVACALDVLPPDSHLQIADLGTGSGALALALAHERPECRFLATDQSIRALEVAAANARQLALDNIEFVAGDWCDALASRRFDLILSNPPYIPEADKHLDEGDVRFEPRAALVAGTDGLHDLARIVECAHTHLYSDAWLMLEHGYDQGNRVRALLQQQGFRAINLHRDAAGHERVTTARL
ncbi:MAG: peptide chain release factor N(5)-glutamine methyltransferase [Gammaproteobacteria bacterium]